MMNPKGGEIIKLPLDVLKTIDTIESAGYQAWAVGGCVRDSLLGKVPKDYDIASSCPPFEIIRLFPRCINTGEAYGTVTVLMPSMPIEVTVFRSESGYSDSRHPDRVVPANSIETDLSRRDFTVNAMAWHPQRGLCDPYGGQSDLKHRIVRAVGDPRARFSEDALRIIRCLRFASVLDFDIEQATLEAASSLAPTLRYISAERINSELRRLLTGFRPELAGLIVKSGGLAHFGIDCMTQPELLRQIPAAKTLRLAAFLYLSNIRSAECARWALNLLRTDHRTIKEVTLLLESIKIPLPEDIVSLKHSFRTIPPDKWGGLLTLSEVLSGEKTDRVRELLPQTEGHPWNRSMLAVNGNDMASLGYRQKDTGRILDILLDMVLRDPNLNRREELLRIALEIKPAQNDSPDDSVKK
jgi:tRNA nucleotidyltransferase (CCA-adding enzyme)